MTCFVDETPDIKPRKGNIQITLGNTTCVMPINIAMQTARKLAETSAEMLKEKKVRDFKR